MKKLLLVALIALSGCFSDRDPAAPVGQLTLVEGITYWVASNGNDYAKLGDVSCVAVRAYLTAVYSDGSRKTQIVRLWVKVGGGDRCPFDPIWPY